MINQKINKMGYQQTTVRGYDFFEVSSSLQKAIRRNDVRMAGYFALELFHSNFTEYVWKRLLTISVEDCHSMVTKEIKAIHESFLFINKGQKIKKGRIFISKAVIILCRCPKSRDADHLQTYIYDKKIEADDKTIEEYFEKVRRSQMEIPQYAYDCHTLKGKRNGKTKDDFFKEEQEGLNPLEPGLFDHLAKKI